MSLRTPATEARYQAARASGQLRHLLGEPAVAEFRLWKVIDNRFPHDRHHTVNHLVVLKRDCPVENISTTEWEEFWKTIMPWANARGYDYIKFNLSNVRSVNATPHLHLMSLKQEYK